MAKNVAAWTMGLLSKEIPACEVTEHDLSTSWTIDSWEDTRVLHVETDQPLKLQIMIGEHADPLIRTPHGKANLPLSMASFFGPLQRLQITSSHKRTTRERELLVFVYPADVSDEQIRAGAKPIGTARMTVSLTLLFRDVND